MATEQHSLPATASAAPRSRYLKPRYRPSRNDRSEPTKKAAAMPAAKKQEDHFRSPVTTTRHSPDDHEFR